MNERPNYVENLDPDAGESPEDPTPSPTLPDLDGVPEDDSAESEDAEVEHLASEEEVLDEEQQRRAAARAQHYPESDDEE